MSDAAATHRPLLHLLLMSTFLYFPHTPKAAMPLTADVGDRWAAGEGEGAFWQQPRPTQRKGEGEVFSFLSCPEAAAADRGSRRPHQVKPTLPYLRREGIVKVRRKKGTKDLHVPYVWVAVIR